MLKDFNKHSLFQDPGPPRVQNPPWADKILNANWEAIFDKLDQHGLDRALMPRHTRSRRGGPIPEKEFGCGHFGCVYRTDVPGWLCKITTDETEAAFTAITRELRNSGEQVPEGFVEYLDVFKLRGATKRGGPAFILWREYATEAGWAEIRAYLALSSEDPAGRNLMRELVNALNAAGVIGSGVRYFHNMYGKGAWEHIQGILEDYQANAEAVEAFWNAPPLTLEPPRVESWTGVLNIFLYLRALRELQQNRYGEIIGRGMEAYFHKGLILADVHYHNIGLIGDRHDFEIKVIDPGHMIVLNSQWARVPIEQV